MKTTRSDFLSIPKVAIIGRPNVGKSTLFNILTNSRKAVVKNQPGVTRDIQIETCEIWDKMFDIIDTGGITESTDVFSKLIREQVVDFLETVDLLLVVMDGRAGLLPEDRDLLRIAKEAGKPFLLLINKVDSPYEHENAKMEFYEFGHDMVVTSFETRSGLAETLEWIHKQLPDDKVQLKDGVTVAIVGKPNVGKSSMVNALLNEKRMMVSDIAGTTVDAIDTPFIFEDKRYILVDTAGLRKSARREEDVEIIAAFKSHDSIRKADVVLLMIDGTEGPTDQDAKILESIIEDHKGVIVVANKSDLGREIPEFRKAFKEQCERIFHFYTDVPVIFTSAKNKTGITELMEKVQWMAEKLSTRISTKELNDFFLRAIRKAPAPVYGVVNVKFYYLTQTFQKPPSFIAFANHPDGVDNAYRRFLIKQLKTEFDLFGIPIRIFVMKSKGKGE